MYTKETNTEWQLDPEDWTPEELTRWLRAVCLECLNLANDKIQPLLNLH